MEKALLEKPHEASWRAIPALLVLGCFATLAFVATPPGSTSTVVSHAADAEPHQMKSSQKHYAFEDEVQRVGELSPQLRAVVTQLAQHGAKISDKQDHILTQAIETRMSGLLAIKADVDELSQEKDHHHDLMEKSKLAYNNAKTPKEKIEAALKFYSPRINQFSRTKAHSEDHAAKMQVIDKIKELKSLEKRVDGGEELTEHELNIDFDEEEGQGDAAADADVNSAAPVIGQTLKRVDTLKENLARMKSGTALSKTAAKVHFLFDVLTMRANSDHELHVAVNKLMNKAVDTFALQYKDAQKRGKVLTKDEQKYWHEALWQMSLKEKKAAGGLINSADDEKADGPGHSTAAPAIVASEASKGDAKDDQSLAARIKRGKAAIENAEALGNSVRAASLKLGVARMEKDLNSVQATRAL